MYQAPLKTERILHIKYKATSFSGDMDSLIKNKLEKKKKRKEKNKRKTRKDDKKKNSNFGFIRFHAVMINYFRV